MKVFFITIFCLMLGLTVVSAQEEVFNTEDEGFFVQDVATVTVEAMGDGYVLTFTDLPTDLTSLVSSEGDLFTSSYPLDAFLTGFNNTDDDSLNLAISARLQLDDRVLAFVLMRPQFEEGMESVTFEATLDEENTLFTRETDGKLGAAVRDRDIPGTYEDAKIVYTLNGDELTTLTSNILDSMRLGSITIQCMTCGK